MLTTAYGRVRVLDISLALYLYIQYGVRSRLHSPLNRTLVILSNAHFLYGMVANVNYSTEYRVFLGRIRSPQDKASPC